MIHSDERNGVTVLRMEHGKVNALDTELLSGIVDVLDGLEAGRGPIVLTGSGTVFSAGVDLFRVVGGGRDYLQTFLPALTEAFRRVFEFPRPIVAAVNGHAIAGGCVLACACDYRIMARGNGRMGVPELYVGVPFPTMALEIMRFATPKHRFQEIVLSGRTLLPEQAAEYGLVDTLAESGELLDRACAEAHRYGSISAATFRFTKRQLRAPVIERFERLFEHDDAQVKERWMEPATFDGIQGYLDRTLGSKS